MVALSSLWLPILLSAVAVFILSSIIHMATPWHKNDYPKLPNEDAVADALRPLALQPGDYMLPRAESSKEMGTPAFVEKLERGPVLMMTVMPNGQWTMGRTLMLSFVHPLVVGLFSAYLTSRSLGAGTDYLRVFQLAGTTASGLRPGALADDDLVPSLGGHHAEVDDRWPALRVGDWRDVRLALASLTRVGTSPANVSRW